MSYYIIRIKIYLFSLLALFALTIIACFSFYYGQYKWVLYRQAEDNFEKKEYVQAIKIYQEAIYKGINLWVIADHLAYACIALNDCSSSVEIYESLVENNQDDIYILMATATFYVNLNRFDKSAALYKRALELKPRDHKILRDLALSYKWNDQYLLAIKTFKKLLSLMKKPSLKIISEIGECYILDEQFQKGLKYYQRVLEEEPKNFEVKRKIALAYSWTGQEDKGIEILEELYAEEEENIGLGIDLAKIYIQDRRYEEARVLLEKLHQQAPLDEGLIFQRILLEVDLGHMVRAKEMVEELLKANDFRKDLYLPYAQIMRKWGDYYKAEEIYKSYIEENPYILTPYYDLADLFIKMERFYEAENIFLELLSQNKRSLNFYEQMTQINLKKGEYKTALYWINKMLSDDVTNSSARILKAECFINLKEFDKAKEEIANIYKYTPSFLLKEEGQLPIGKLYLQMEEEAQAKIYFDKALTLEPNDTVLRFYTDFLLHPNEELIKKYEEENSFTFLELQKLADISSSYNFHESAIRLYKKSLEKDSENFQAKLGLAISLAALKKHKTSLEYLFELLEDFPNNYKILLFIARNYNDKKDYVKASYYYQLLQKNNPQDYLPFQEEAKMAYAENKPGKAKKLYQQKLSPSVDDLLIKNLEEENLLEKIQIYQDIFLKEEGSIYQFYEKMYEDFQKGKYPLSYEDDKKLEIIFLRLDASYQMQRLFVLENRAKGFLWQEKPRKAEKALKELLIYYPLDVEALFEVAQIQCLLNQCDKSLQTFEKIVTAHPFHPEAKRAYELNKIRTHPSVEGANYYYDENGRGEIDQISTERIDLSLCIPFSCRYKLFLEGHYWYEMPKFGSGLNSSAEGYSIETEAIFSEDFQLAAGFQQKFYTKNAYPTANTGFLEFLFSWDNFQFGGGYRKENNMDNYFNLLQKTQYGKWWMEAKATIKKRLLLECKGRWQLYNDHNSMQYHDLHLYYNIFLFPTSLQTLFSAEVRDARHLNIFQTDAQNNTINIIYPYWTPKKYSAFRGGLQWLQDLSHLHLCSSQKHYYILKILSGNDSEKNPMISFEGEWHLEFFNHWFLNLKGLIHRSKLWDSSEAKVELKYQF